MTQREAWIWSAIILAVLVLGVFASARASEIGTAIFGTASWYSTESCHAEGTSGIMANGKAMDNEAFTAASWDYRFGTVLRVTNLDNHRSVLVVVSDRGPSKRLVRRGRIIDLSRGAFRRLARLEAGIIKIKVEVVR